MAQDCVIAIENRIGMEALPPLSNGDSDPVKQALLDGFASIRTRAGWANVSSTNNLSCARALLIMPS